MTCSQHASATAQPAPLAQAGPKGRPKGRPGGRLGGRASVRAGQVCRSAILVLFLGLTAAPASAQPRSTLPACQGRLETTEALSACFDVARPGTAEFLYAGVHLGSELAEIGDFPAAARVFDRLDPPGGNIVGYSGALYHALRAETYWRMERIADALPDAQIAYALLNTPRASRPDLHLEVEVLARILPALTEAGDPLAVQALADLKGLDLPASDAIALANRAVALFEVGETEASISEARRALAADPDLAPVHNNLCYILARSGRAAEALPFCNQAVAAMPEIPAFHHSHAVALAALGRCAESSAAQARARKLAPGWFLYQGDLACTPSPPPTYAP